VNKAFKYFGYGVFLLNGQGQNVLETNNQKEVALRLEAYPAEGCWSAGGGHRPWRGPRWARLPRGGRPALRARPVRHPGRVHRGQDHINPIKGVKRRRRHRQTRTATNVAAGYTISRWSSRGPLRALRAEHGRTFHPARWRGDLAQGRADRGLELGRGDVYEIGLNWFIHDNEAKVQASYSMFDWTDVRAEHQIIVSNQLTF
jgi:hypothetical protein